jgi:hypothetical protein
MTTTEKRITIAFTKRQLQELNTLCEKMGEPPSAIIHRAITFLYYEEKPETVSKRG